VLAKIPVMVITRSTYDPLDRRESGDLVSERLIVASMEFSYLM